MLEELHIRNFAIIEHLELEFGNGFNVITGETGAGKSIIVDAVELILGGKADTSMIRTGAEKAVVEGTFALSDKIQEIIRPTLVEEDLQNNGKFITLSREVRNNGRSTARINGISVRQEVLREVGNALVDIHGQSEHISLFNPPHHIDLLDRYADLMEIREALRTVTHKLGDVRKEIRILIEDEEALAKRAEQIKRDVEEIDAAALKPGEDDEIKAERNRLANSEQLATLITEASMLLNGDETSDDQSPIVDMLMRVSTIMSKVATIDPDLSNAAELAEGVSAQAQELSIEIAGYGDEVEYDPVRINEIEERLEVINTMKRRFGITIEFILEKVDMMRKELNGIENSEERLIELREQETQFLTQIGELSENISSVRYNIGRQLSEKVIQELKDLRMENTQFEVSLTRIEDPEGCFCENGKRYKFDYTGIDHVEFMMSANPGEPMRQLAKVASGGEAARIMLALKRVLTQADHTPTLIFDEVDQGIGGRVGSVVGEKLWSLTKGHQVLVVTHMPQLAGYADRHFHVKKQMTKDRTVTVVNELKDDPTRIEELSSMLGATGEGSKQSAMEILDEAREKKGVTKQKKLL